jgi:hypothetical protein
VLGAVGRFMDAHLRDRHLGHVHERIDAVVLAHNGHVGRRFQIGRVDRHAEIDPPAAFEHAVRIVQIEQVADDDLGSQAAQRHGALVLAPHHGSHFESPVEQGLGDDRADGSDPACRAGHQDGMGVMHATS